MNLIREDNTCTHFHSSFYPQYLTPGMNHQQNVDTYILQESIENNYFCFTLNFCIVQNYNKLYCKLIVSDFRSCNLSN